MSLGREVFTPCTPKPGKALAFLTCCCASLPQVALWNPDPAPWGCTAGRPDNPRVSALPRSTCDSRAPLAPAPGSKFFLSHTELSVPRTLPSGHPVPDQLCVSIHQNFHDSCVFFSRDRSLGRSTQGHFYFSLWKKKKKSIWFPFLDIRD